MSPGRTGRSPASSVRRALAVSPGASTATTRPSRMTRPQSKRASGRTTRASLMNRSAVTASGRAEDLAVGVGPAELEEPPQVAGVVARPGVDVGVQDLVGLAPGPPDAVPAGIDEPRRAEVGAARRTADVRADLVDAAHVEHVGDGVPAQLHLPHLADPVAVGRGGHDDEMRALETQDARGLREVAVVGDEDPPFYAKRGVEHGEAEVAGREEEALARGRLPR